MVLFFANQDVNEPDKQKSTFAARRPLITRLVDTHIYGPVRKTITGSGNGLSPVRNQTSIWTNDDML